MPQLQVNNLKAWFHTRNGIVKAVDGVSFSLEKGETLGIVGESGSGKSVTCYALLGLIPSPPGKIESGQALFNGTDLLTLNPSQIRKIRGKKIAMIFQDPMTSLNPYLRIQDQLIEPLLIHGLADKKKAIHLAIEFLERVGIQDAQNRIRSFPHEFSGGMRQRVMIAMALITKPEILIADEPTTALDVTVQAQILELIADIQKDMGMSVILVSHDLGVVSGFCRKVQVMYAGRVVEAGSTEDIFKRPLHPYNKALQTSTPSTQSKGKELATIPGLPPDLSKEIQGCSFAPRCSFTEEICHHEPIDLLEIESGHASACVRVQKGTLDL